jgi:hypothetical protein
MSGNGTQIGQVSINLRMNLVQLKTDVQDGNKAIKDSMDKLKADVGNSSGEARGSLMLLSEEIGVHIPRHLQSAIAALPGFSTALNAAFGTIAVVAMIEVLVKIVEKIQDLGKAAKENADAWTKLGADGQAAIKKVDDQILSLRIQMEQLSGEYMAALQDSIKQIDNQTLKNITDQFKTLGDEADKAFVGMKTSAFQSWIFGQGNNEAVDRIAASFAALKKNVDDLAAAGNNAGIGSALTKQITDVKAALASYTPDVTNSSTQPIIDALQKELSTLQTLDTYYSKVNKEREGQTQKVVTVDNQRKENDGDKELSAQKNLNDEKAKLADDYFKLQLAQNSDGYSKLRKLNEDDIAAQEEAATTAADTKYTADVQYWEKLKAAHTLNTEADKKIRQDADNQIELLGVKHQDALTIIETDGANKRSDLQKQEIERADQAAQQAIRLSEQEAKAKLSAADTYYLGVSDRLKQEAAEHEISYQEELAGLLQVNQQKYQADIDYLNTRVLDAAKLLVIEASKNGQILTMDEALITARQGLNADYIKAHQTLLNEDQKAEEENTRALIKEYANVTTQFQSQLNTMLTTGKANWSSFFQSIETDMLKLIEKNLFGQLLGPLTSGGGFLGSIGAMFGLGGGAAAPLAGGSATWGLAAGGPIYQDGGRWVGEQGPEFFTPNTSGRIIPAAQMPSSGNGGGTQTNVELHVHGVTDADSFRKSQGQIAAEIAAEMSKHAQRNG